LWFHQQKLCCDQQTSWFQRPNWKFSMKSRDWNQLQRILLDQCVPRSTYMGCCKHYDLSLSGAAYPPNRHWIIAKLIFSSNVLRVKSSCLSLKSSQIISNHLKFVP
jgi:hypothetical protein